MQPAAYPLVSDIVLIGGGHAHALVLRMWGMNPLPGVRLTVINPDPVAPYTGMLPGHIAGHYTRADMTIDLVRLARFAGARLILDRVTAIDRTAQEIRFASRPPLEYDVASLDIGITSDLPDLPGFPEHAASAKPLGVYAQDWQSFLTHSNPSPHLTIVGGGVGGIELALASAHRLRAVGKSARVTVLEAGPAALPGLSPRSRDHLLRAAAALGVHLTLNAHPISAAAGSVTLADGTVLPSDFTLTVTGARPHPWVQQTGLDLDQGFVRVGPTLQSSDRLIFAVGDCASLTHAPRPKAGVFAVRAAPILHHNLRASLTGAPLRPFAPQADYLKLISLGGKQALADKWGLTLAGGALWRLKDRIDRKFMAKFTDYPAMPATPLPTPAVQGLAELLAERPLCGGCGAKVGPDVLSASLSGLHAHTRPDVIAGPGDDAALLRHGTGVQVITTDHLRAFTHDPRLMARIAATHALGDIWAMGAAPQAALSQITLPRLSPRLQSRMLTDILTAASEVFGAAGADIVGGHTSIGSELTIGFTVTGLTAHPIAKSGARPGDAVILTKSLGTGTIMAAEMALAHLPDLLLGEVVARAFTSMTRPQGAASAILAPHAHAMTDVTGFGLAGHLMEILEASGVAATLYLSAIPTLPGAIQLVQTHPSSIAPANRAALLGRITGTPGPVTPLLYDPQTGGGLLACVPAAMAPSLLIQLRQTDPDAALIGQVTDGPPAITTAP